MKRKCLPITSAIVIIVMAAAICIGSFASFGAEAPETAAPTVPPGQGTYAGGIKSNDPVTYNFNSDDGDDGSRAHHIIAMQFYASTSFDGLSKSFASTTGKLKVSLFRWMGGYEATVHSDIAQLVKEQEFNVPTNSTALVDFKFDTQPDGENVIVVTPGDGYTDPANMVTYFAKTNATKYHTRTYIEDKSDGKWRIAENYSISYNIHYVNTPNNMYGPIMDAVPTVTEPPVTESPATEPPATESPATEPPATESTEQPTTVPSEEPSVNPTSEPQDGSEPAAPTVKPGQGTYAGGVSSQEPVTYNFNSEDGEDNGRTHHIIAMQFYASTSFDGLSKSFGSTTGKVKVSLFRWMGGYEATVHSDIAQLVKEQEFDVPKDGTTALVDFKFDEQPDGEYVIVVTPGDGYTAPTDMVIYFAKSNATKYHTRAYIEDASDGKWRIAENYSISYNIHYVNTPNNMYGPIMAAVPQSTGGNQGTTPKPDAGDTGDTTGIMMSALILTACVCCAALVIFKKGKGNINQ